MKNLGGVVEEIDNRSIGTLRSSLNKSQLVSRVKIPYMFVR
jgi:hypothetical protein